MKLKATILVAGLSLAASAAIATAQDNNQRDQDRGDRGDRRGGNFEEFRQRMNDRLKASLKATDEEWTVIQPLIEKVQTKQREGMAGRFGGFPGGGGGGRGRGDGGQGGDGERRDRGGDRGDRGDRGGSPESQALRAALENESTSADELKSKLNAVREARKKSASELAQAREELRKVLSVRQEAALVASGILE